MHPGFGYAQGRLFSHGGVVNMDDLSSNFEFYELKEKRWQVVDNTE